MARPFFPNGGVLNTTITFAPTKLKSLDIPTAMDNMMIIQKVKKRASFIHKPDTEQKSPPITLNSSLACRRLKLQGDRKAADMNYKYFYFSFACTILFYFLFCF
jgi:hypothetical protein